MEDIKGTEVDEPTAGLGEGIQEAQADGTPTPPIKTEPKRQVTLRIPAVLYDRIAEYQPKDMDLNPWLISILTAGTKVMDTLGTKAVVEVAAKETAPVSQMATENFITRAHAHDLVTGAINAMVQRTGDRIDTRDLGEGPTRRPGLRSLVKDALLG